MDKAIDWATEDTGKPCLSRGSFDNRSILTDLKVLNIKVLLSQGVKRKALAKRFRVPAREIRDIDNGVRWAHVDATAMIAKLTMPDSVWG